MSAMQRRLWVGIALLALGGAASAGALELEIEVREGGEGPPGELAPTDIQIQFGGKEAAVTKLRYVEGLSETKLYIGAEMPAQDFPLIEAALEEMIEKLPAGVEVSLGGAPFTSDKAKLREVLALGVEIPGKTPDAGMVEIWDFGQGYRIHGRPILDKYTLLASQLARVPGQKRVVMYRESLELRQDGLDTRDMNIRTGSVRQNDADMLRNEDDMQRLGTIAAVSRVRFYTSNSSTNVAAMNDHGLNSVAGHTGGKPLLGGGNPADVLRVALEDLPGYYVATFDAELKGNGARRNLKAQVRRKGSDAKFARSFLIDLPGLESIGAATEDLLAKEAVDATLEIQSQQWVFRGPDGKPMVIVCAGAPASALEGANADKGVAVELSLGAGYKNAAGWSTEAQRRSRQVFDRKAFGNAQKKGDVTVDVAASGALPGPGMHAWKTVLKSESDGAFGVIETEVGAHDLSRPMSTSDVLITRRAIPIKPDTPAEPWGDLLDFGGMRLIPESTRELKVGEPVLFTYRLYNAPAEMIQNPPPVQLALFKDEQQLESFDGQGQSRVIEGSSEIHYVGSIETKGLEPGEYLILSAVPGREDERHPYVEGAFRLVKK